MDKLKGIVKFYKKDKGWGFVTAGTKDYFVHISNVLGDDKTLYVGEEINFNTIETVNGVMAVEIERTRRPSNSLGDKAPRISKETKEEKKQEA